MVQTPTKHEDPRHEPSARKVVGEEGSLVLPLAEPGPGAPLVGATGVKGAHIDDGERDPDTIAEEQRRRSAAYEAGATMQEVATPDIPDSTIRRVAPPSPARGEPHPQPQPRHPDNHSRR